MLIIIQIIALLNSFSVTRAALCDPTWVNSVNSGCLRCEEQCADGSVVKFCKPSNCPALVNECAIGADNCDQNHATCTDTPTGFLCECNAGYNSNDNGVTCDDVDECAAQTHTCDTNADCSNTYGSYECICYIGFTGDGFSCTADQLLILNNKPGYYFDPAIRTTGNENEGNPNANTYSIIGTFDQSKKDQYKGSDGKYEFKLVYTYNDGHVDTLKWKQSSWLTDTTIIGADLFGVPQQTVTDTTQDFEGLGLNSGGYESWSYLDGDAGKHHHFWNAVGEIKNFNGGIPGFNGKSPAITSALYILKTTSSAAHSSIGRMIYEPIDKDYYFEISESTLMVIGGLIGCVLIINILFLCRANCYGKKKSGYRKVKFVDTDTEFVDSEANLVS